MILTSDCIFPCFFVNGLIFSKRHKVRRAGEYGSRVHSIDRHTMVRVRRVAIVGFPAVGSFRVWWCENHSKIDD